ncbi:solute carrier family 23 protein [Mycolicibacterium brumae]|uniref:solute carrier family 23 protein n=1 Tax=Mycolicibacterium brumae TaxID=85968 RepID=UPI0021B01BF0|nr:solute carrier family 23 protein [Mycolicibacterium brumae]
MERVFGTDQPLPRRYMRGGELILTGLIFHTGTPAESEAFVASAAEGGALAIGAGVDHFGEIPEHLRAACRRWRVPLFSVPADVSFADITQEVIDRAIAELGRLRRGLARSRELLTAVAAGRALDDVLARVVAVTGVRCWVLTAGGKRVAAVSPALSEARIDEILAALIRARDSDTASARDAADDAAVGALLAGTSVSDGAVLVVRSQAGGALRPVVRDALVSATDAVVGLDEDRVVALIPGRPRVDELVAELRRQLLRIAPVLNTWVRVGVSDVVVADAIGGAYRSARFAAELGEPPVEGLRHVYGAVIVAAVLCLLITPFFAKVVRFFPEVVTGSIITVIGLSLMPVAAGWITGPATVKAGKATVPNPDYGALDGIALGLFTFLVVIVLSKIEVLSRLAVLLGLVIGTVAGLVTGQVDLSGVGDAGLVALPQPFAFGMPLFEIGAILSMVIVMLVIMVETTADLLAVGEVVGAEVDSRRVADGLRADMLSSAVAPVFNSFPATAFAQNVGLVALTGIGAGIVLFGTVAASGVRTLSKVNYTGTNNLVLVAASVGFGLIPVVAPNFWHEFPDWFVTIFHSGICASAVVAVLLNLFFNVFLPGIPDDPNDFAAAPPLRVQETEIDILERGGTLDPASYEPDSRVEGTRARDTGARPDEE